MKVKDLLADINEMLATDTITPDTDIAVAVIEMQADGITEKSVQYIDRIDLDWIWKDIFDTEDAEKILTIEATK